MNFNNKEQKMNLKDLARMIHSDLESQGKGIDMKTVLTVVKQVVDTISNGYSEDKYSKIVIPGFGSFINYWTKEKRNSNPQTGRIETIQPKRKLKFKISSSLVDKVN